MKNLSQVLVSICFVIALYASGTTSHAEKMTSLNHEALKVYVLDGGTMNLNMVPFSIDNSYSEDDWEFINNPIILIEHPNGRMIWDTGIPDRYADLPLEERSQGGGSFEVKKKLIDQLADMGLTPDSIDYLALSHTHFDHAGNANYFKNSTWLVRQEEYDFAFSISGEYDVFGDGKVVIYHYPGHTPGHSTLYVQLENRQDVMFTGDLYHTTAQRAFMRIPQYNTDYEQTLNSMQAFEQKVKALNVDVIIQHDKEHYKKLPKYPQSWE